MTSPPEPHDGGADPTVESLLERARGSEVPILVIAPAHASLEPLRLAAAGSGAVVVPVPRTAVDDPFAPLWSALGGRPAGNDREQQVRELIADRTLVVTDLDRGHDDLVDLVRSLGTNGTPVVATTTRTGRAPGFDAVAVGGWGVTRDVPAVDHADALAALIGDDADAAHDLVADWILRGEPTHPAAGLASYAASVADADAMARATATAAGRAGGALRAVLLSRLEDPSAGAAAREALASGDRSVGDEVAGADSALADLVVLHRLAASDLTPADPARAVHLVAAASAALLAGRHDEAAVLLGDELLADDGGDDRGDGPAADAAFLRVELLRRLELPELDDVVDRGVLRSDRGEALVRSTSWLPGRRGVSPVDVPAFQQSAAALAVASPGSADLRAGRLLVDALVLGGRGEDDPAAATTDRPRRDAALDRLASGLVGLHRSVPPAQVVDRVAFAADPTAGTGLSALAVAHLAVALGDSGRSSEALALLDDHARTGRFAGRPMPQALVRWARAEVELAAGRPARAARVGEQPAGPPLFAGDDPLAWLLQLVLDWSAVETRRPATELDLGTAGGIVTAAPAERDAIALFARDEFAAATVGFLAAERSWRGLHDRGALRCCWAAGESARLADDIEHARELLRRAESEASSLDALPMLSRVRQSLRRAGVRATVARTAGVGPLSGREVEVLRLVGAGRSSIDIGVQLGVAKSTVETQISSAMLKLDAATRLQAAAMLRELEGDQ